MFAGHALYVQVEPHFAPGVGRRSSLSARPLRLALAKKLEKHFTVKGRRLSPFKTSPMAASK